MTDIKKKQAVEKQQFVLRLPKELLAEIDVRAKEKHISRNQWFERMARWGLNKSKTMGVQ